MAIISSRETEEIEILPWSSFDDVYTQTDRQ